MVAGYRLMKKTQKKAESKISSIFNHSNADSVVRTIPNLSTERKEKGFPILKKIKINPYPPRDTTVGGYQSGNVFTGTDSSIDYSFTYNPNVEIPTADLHTHPPKGYSAHSPKDIYNLIEERLQNNQYEGSFVVAANGSRYGLTITDLTKDTAFFNTKSIYLNGSMWKEDSQIGEAFDLARSHYKKVYKGDPNQQNLAFEMAMAAVLGQYNAVVTLNKKDVSDNFKPIIVKTSPDPKKLKKVLYMQECQ